MNREAIVRDDIDRFHRHFSRHIRAAAELKESDEGELFARIMLTTMLDTFSKVALDDPEDKMQLWDRYSKFVREYSGWSGADRVSVLHLERALQHVPDDARFSELLSWSREHLSHVLPPIVPAKKIVNDPGLIQHDIDTVDPFVGEVLERWPKRGPDEVALELPVPELGIRRLGPHRFAHARLLWDYRCALVHEFRSPGSGWDIRKEGKPFYQNMAEVDFVQPAQGGEERDLTVVGRRWELVYPLGFLRSLCEQSLERMSLVLETQGRSPFATFRFGSFWLPRMNEP